MSLLSRLASKLPWNRGCTRVLIVCAGSPCRAPLVQAAADGRSITLAKSKPDIRRLNLRFEPALVRDTEFDADPAGRRCLTGKGYRPPRARARAVTPESIARSHLVLATDRRTLRSLQRRCTSPHAHKLHLLLDFVPGHTGQDLPTPQSGVAEDYSKLIELCERAIVGLTDVLVQKPSGASPMVRPVVNAPANMGSS